MDSQATTTSVEASRVFDSARYLAERLQDVPVHVIPCIVADHIPADAPRRAWGGPATRRATLTSSRRRSLFWPSTASTV